MSEVAKSQSAGSETLFLELPAEKSAQGPFAGVAIERGIDHVLDYSVPASLRALLRPGQRVRVPLGRNNKPAYGYVVSIHPEAGHPKTKPIHSIDDDRTLISVKMMELALWMSRYYVSPLGMVLDCIIPSAVKKKRGLDYARIVRLAKDRVEIDAVLEETKSAKRRAVLARLLILEKDQGIELHRLAGEAGVTTATVLKLVRLGLIEIRQEADLPSLTADLPAGAGLEPYLALNEDQHKVVDVLRPAVTQGGFSVHLLHGVTGSGKTEVYLQCIRQVIAAGKQALVLVPEIALTPQTVRRFMARFPRVAILHSGLTATQRHGYWQQIAAGFADVVVGARSAIFAPLPKLGVIVVDEEHEPSYKQDSAPRYHGRDVAVKRGQLENVPVILGSATPSLETYWRAMRPDGPAPYQLLSLPRRVRGLSMPTVEMIDLRQERALHRGPHLISLRLEKLLHQTLEAGHQAILLLNRRGYSNFVYCPSCGYVASCEYCDASLTYHRWGGPPVGSAAFDKSIHAGSLHCHYCLAVTPLPHECPTCGKKLSLFGLGTQRVEEELTRKFPAMKFARVDSDTMRSGRDYEAL
ncbi:MAG TPA: primosomal protein N', partial [Tepidisphaeraceae bacterium]|nr:primosomal protein N' [Tepidisphaeraceae bacterium]